MRTLLIILLLSVSIQSFSQLVDKRAESQSPFGLYIGYSIYNDPNVKVRWTDIDTDKNFSTLRVEPRFHVKDYGFVSAIYSHTFRVHHYSQAGQGSTATGWGGFHYLGLSGNLGLTPLIGFNLPNESLIYAKGEVAIGFLNANKDSRPKRGIGNHYAAGFGAYYHIFENWGMYSEYTWGGLMDWRIGLSARF